MTLTHPLSILTGSSGTGKTACLKASTATISDQNKQFTLASPTGRAAKHLFEATGHPASTIHRFLEFSSVEGFKHNEDRPLDMVFVVVGEVSMLDLLWMNNLLKAARPGMHVLFVGHIDQLPSVGAGDVLRHMISS